MAHYHSSDGDHFAGSAAQVQTMLLEIPEKRNAKRRSDNQARNRQPGSLRQNQTYDLHRSHPDGHEHAEFTGPLEYRHEHRVHDTDDRNQKENKKENDSDAMIELNVVRQFRRELRPCHHPHRESLTQTQLKGGSYGGSCCYLIQLDPDFVDSRGHEMKQILQRR